MAANFDLVTDPAIGEPGRFAVAEIHREAMAKGITLGDDAQATRVFLTIEEDANVAAKGYSIRVQEEAGRRVITVRGSDATGSMYGGLDIAEAIRLGTLDSLQSSEHQPHIARRGIKFNIPLDLRTPSYSDNSTSAQANIPEMWSLDFWQEFIDRMARDRYNVLTLWNLQGQRNSSMRLGNQSTRTKKRKSTTSLVPAAHCCPQKRNPTAQVNPHASSLRL